MKTTLDNLQFRLFFAISAIAIPYWNLLLFLEQL